MNYELAKKLKDAGFPQEKKQGKYRFENEFETDELVLEIEQPIYVPTLSELIEACGWISLDPDYLGRWIAIERALKDSPNSDEPARGASGSTPEEAVALLWLELNNK